MGTLDQLLDLPLEESFAQGAVGLASGGDEDIQDWICRLTGADSAVFDEHDDLAWDSVWCNKNEEWYHLRTHYFFKKPEKDDIIDLIDKSGAAFSYGQQNHLVFWPDGQVGIKVEAREETDSASANGVHSCYVTQYSSAGEAEVNLVRKVNPTWELNQLEALRLLNLHNNPLEDLTAPTVCKVADHTLWTERIPGPTAKEQLRGPEKMDRLYRLAKACQDLQKRYTQETETWSKSLRMLLPTPNTQAVEDIGPEHVGLIRYLRSKNRFNTYIPDCRPSNFFFTDAKLVKIDEGGKMVGSPECFIGKLCDYDDTISEKERDQLITMLDLDNVHDATLSLYVSTLMSAQPHKNKNRAVYAHRMRRARGYLTRVEGASGWNGLRAELDANAYARATA